MSRRKSVFKVFLCLALLLIFSAGVSSAQGGISLSRTPAPPQGIYNDGTHSVTFSWNIDYATHYNQNYILEIIDPSNNVVHTDSFAGAPSVITKTASWLVPAGAQSGPYYGRLSFFSDWWPLLPNKYEDQATVGFVVSPVARIQIRKFWDWWLADGIKQGFEETLEGWQFTVKRVDTGQEWYLISGSNGYTESIMVPVNPTGTTDFTITEETRPGWVKTGPNGAINPITITLSPGQTYCEDWGNWQPITVEGYKYLDEQPWPLPGNVPINTTTPLPNTKPIAGVQFGLYGYNWILLDLATTDANGHFSFPTRTWEDKFYIVEQPLPAATPGFDIPGATPPVCAIHEPDTWLLSYVGTASQSVWRDPEISFTEVDTITLATPQPSVFFQSYAGNYFYNRLPSRIWGTFCAGAISLGLGTLEITKDGIPWPSGDADALADCGFYQVPTLAEEPEGLRPGTYTLTPPALPDPANQHWLVTKYEEKNGVLSTTSSVVPSGGSYSLYLESGKDVRVDFCIETAPSRRVCNLPVTFTQAGFHNLSDPANTIIPGGIIYSRFKSAFPGHKLIVGNVATSKTITYDDTTGSMKRLVQFLPQTLPSGKLDRAYIDPWDKTSAGTLAGETITLLLNIALNEAAVMPRTPGWQLDKFTLNDGIFKGKTVGQVFTIASKVLAGDPPSKYGLANYQALVDVLQAINSNYEFVDYDTYNDRGYLTTYGTHKKAGESTPISVPYAP